MRKTLATLVAAACLSIAYTSDTARPLPSNPQITIDWRSQLTPKLTQTHTDLPHGGQYYCVPTAASSALFYLQSAGYGLSLPSEQLDLIKELGSRMNASEKGVLLPNLIRGLEGYLSKEANQFAIRPTGFWLDSYADFHDQVPDLKTIKANQTALLVFGFYNFIKENNGYVRQGGHAVTFVGSTNPYELFIHDRLSEN